MTTTHMIRESSMPDLVRAPADQDALDAEAAELDAARAEAMGLLAELRRLEAAAPPPDVSAAGSFSRRIATAVESGAALALRRLSDEMRPAITAAEGWRDEVEAARATLADALNADETVVQARERLALAHQQATPLAARVRELRATLAALEGQGPTDTATAGAWAQQVSATRAELGAIERLANGASATIAPAEAALRNAEAAVVQRLAGAAAAGEQDARQAWDAARVVLDAEHGAKVAAARRVAVALTAAARTL